MKRNYENMVRDKIKYDREKGQRTQKIIKFNAKSILERGFKDYNEYFSQTF